MRLSYKFYQLADEDETASHHIPSGRHRLVPTQDHPQSTPGQSASRTSLAKVPATCVQDAPNRYIPDVLVSETLWIMIEPIAGYVPLEIRHQSHTPSPPPKHLPGSAQRQSGGQSGVQAHGTIEKSKHSELHPSTTGSTARPRRKFTVLHSQLSQFHSHKNDPHLEERPSSSLWIIQSCSSPTCTSPDQLLQWGLITSTRPYADRLRFTSTGRLQCSPFTLAVRNNGYERQPPGFYSFAVLNADSTTRLLGNTDPAAQMSH